MRQPILFRCATAVLVASVAVALAAASPLRAPGGEDELVKELLATRDASDPARVQELAELKTRDALEGLIEVYDGVGSVFMRRELARAVATFDDCDVWEPALEFVANVATQASEPELREAGVVALEAAEEHGKLFLRKIVDSPANDEVREMAFAAHLRRATKDDESWYREIYKKPPPTEEEIEARKKKQKEDKVREKRGETVEKEERVLVLGSLRVMAFEHLLQGFKDDELVDALKDGTERIRAIALEELERRGDKRAQIAATGMFENLGEDPENRAVAAGVLARAQGTELAETFIEMGDRVITPHVLRNELADLLRGMNDPDVEKKLMRGFGKGKTFQKLFVLRATRDSEDAKYTDKLAKLAKDKDPEVATAALAVLAERADPAGLEEVQKLLEKTKDVFVRRGALQALAAMTRASSGFDEAELREMLESEDVAVKNLALRELAADEANADLAVQALEADHWSTRVTALEALVLYREAKYIPAILARMSREQGRFVSVFADALWRLTGKPFENSVPRWQAWWEREGAGFEPIEPDALDELEQEREERRLRSVSKVEKEFFGIEITSQRVIFVLDISGSMNAPMKMTSAGGGVTRIQVAVKQLKKAIDSIDETALFNVIAFNQGLMTWNDEIVQALPENKADAKQWVDRLGVASATNLYGALRRAFMDEDVDTMYVVSDGEPMGGAKDDPWDIRDDVERWNTNRGIVIHTITVGGKLQILQWLAEDSGGSHVRLQ